jgi:hypothetical protein
MCWVLFNIWSASRTLVCVVKKRGTCKTRSEKNELSCTEVFQPKLELVSVSFIYSIFISPFWSINYLLRKRRKF